MNILEPCNRDLASGRLIDECAEPEPYPFQGNLKIDVAVASSNSHMLSEASLLPSISVSGLDRLKAVYLNL